MIVKPDFEFLTFEKEDMVFKFLKSGDIFEILHKDIMINMFNGTFRDGSLNNIYLRIYEHDEVKVVPLIGGKSNGEIYFDSNSMMFEGDAFGISYRVRFTLSNHLIWFYEVDLNGKNFEVDLLYCQDISISNKNACLNNELYTSQYIDHKAIESSNGFVVCSRQNQDQGGKFPYVEHGCINGNIISYSTDQTQFFSLEYKKSGIPYIIDKDLPKENYQFELAYIVLQTEKMRVDNNKNICFYGLFRKDYKTSIETLKYEEDVVIEYLKVLRLRNNFEKLKRVQMKEEFGAEISSEKFILNEIRSIYNERKFEEYKDNELLSFFTNYHTHVVLQDKEILCERPHGNIIINKIDDDKINTNIITSTNYMFGLFNSQIALGNTSLNKMMSCNRGLLNVIKNSGQRIYIKINDKFRMLTLSGIYEIGTNFSRWYYKFNDDVIIIENYVLRDQTKIVLNVRSQKKIEYEFIITNQIVMGDREYSNGFYLNRELDRVMIKPLEGSFLSNTYKNINYQINFFNCKFNLGDDGIFFKDNLGRDKSIITFKIEKSKEFSISIDGSFEENISFSDLSSLDHEREKFNEFYLELLNGFKLEGKSSKYDVDKLNEIIYFYTHDALIHFSSPHGLEQSSGAAWGTRDVCQGPIEFFTCTNNYKIIKEVLLELFSHQFIENGEFPQWFMFDKYNMQQDDSHGDIIFWPLKALSEYVLNTGDDSIFSEEIVYRSFPSCDITHKESILNHVKRAVRSIEGRFIKDSYLISYAGGDWDDTLQPINENFKERLVSTWTMALSYETLKDLYNVIPDNDFKENIRKMYIGIRECFLKYAIKDDVVSGFLYFNEDDEIEYLLHPFDKITGINYRLLPLTRSIISEIIDLEQAMINEKIIDDHLTFNDGVRLMNNTPRYNGGIPEIFKRAEQASNVGREISLQYVHAHIRFIESMCKLGREEKVWESLYKIIPIKLNDYVENANFRQSNVYFSSSDGAFNNRYDFQDRFNELKHGNVEVKGGWRIYSSGPGIYINQLISNIIGIREVKDRIIFDPIISRTFEELKCSYKILGNGSEILYRRDKELNIKLNGEDIDFVREKNIYGREFISIQKQILNERLRHDKNIIEVFIL